MTHPDSVPEGSARLHPAEVAKTLADAPDIVLPDVWTEEQDAVADPVRVAVERTYVAVGLMLVVVGVSVAAAFALTYRPPGTDPISWSVTVLLGGTGPACAVFGAWMARRSLVRLRTPDTLA